MTRILKSMFACALTGAIASAQKPTNTFGHTVRSQGGQAITYSAAQLSAQSLSQTAPTTATATAKFQGTQTLGSGSSAVDGTGALADWSFFALGTGIGTSQIHVSTANQKTEIIFGAGSTSFNQGNPLWFIMRYEPATKDYVQAFNSPIYPQGMKVKQILVHDVHPSAGPEILVALEDGQIEIWNQASRKLELTLTTSATAPVGLAIGDVDADQKDEIVIASSKAVYIYSLTGTLEWQTAGSNLRDLAIGQMDADPALEIAVSDGRVLDGASRLVEWTWNKGFGIDLEAADIDNDGFDELICAEGWQFVWAYDVDRKLPKWSIPHREPVCVDVADIDNDGVLEVIVGEGQWGDASVFDSVTQAKEWSVRNPEHGMTDITWGDVDGDGVNEVIWGAGFSSSGQDNLFVADSVSHQIEFQSVHVDGPFLGPVRGDLDGDGNDEVIIVSQGSRSNYGGPIIISFDKDLNFLGYSNAISNSRVSSQGKLSLFDTDGDGDMEVIIPHRSLDAWDFDSNTSKFVKAWSMNAPSSSSFYAATFKDLDGNGSIEVVAAANQYVYVYDFATKTKKWNSFYLGPQVLDISIADTDLDQQDEIHARSSDGNIYIFDAATQAVEAIIQHSGSKFSVMSMISTPPFAVLLTADESGGVYAMLPSKSGYTSLGPVPFASSSLDNFAFITGTPFLLSAAGGKIQLHDGLTLLWSTADYGQGFGRQVMLLPNKGMILSAGLYGAAAFIPK